MPAEAFAAPAIAASLRDGSEPEGSAVRDSVANQKRKQATESRRELYMMPVTAVECDRVQPAKWIKAIAKKTAKSIPAAPPAILMALSEGMINFLSNINSCHP